MSTAAGLPLRSMGVGLAAGVGLGLFAGPVALALEPLAIAFLDLLELLVLPLIFCTMVSSVTGIAGGQRLGKAATLTMAFFSATTLLASTVGLVLANVLQPGVGYPVDAAVVPERIATREALGLADVIHTFIQPNLVESAAQMQLLPLLLFAIALGVSLRGLGAEGRPAAAFFESMNAALMRMIGWALRLAPLGIGALVAHQLARAGGVAGLSGIITGVAWWMGTVLLALGAQTAILIALLHLLAPGHARALPRQMLGALFTAFSTASSTATLPITLAAVERAGIEPHTARLVVPLGATLNMNGTALYEATAALFIAQAYGIPLDLPTQMMVVLLASLAGAGAAGIPEAGLVTMVMVLATVGLPVEGIGLLLAVDWLLDRFRTAVNVWGDGTAAAVVDARVSGGPWFGGRSGFGK